MKIAGLSLPWLARLGSPPSCYRFLTAVRPWLQTFFLVLFSYGLVAGLFIAPPDYQQGEGYRIIFVHVPAAFLSLFVYSLMAFYSGVFLVWRVKIAAIFMRCAAPIGALFTTLALLSGAIWGKPMWGTWWVWDARLTSELILLFLYLGVIGVGEAIEETEVADKAQAILALIGIVNIPIIHFSVNWWFTLHQGQTLGFTNNSIADSMKWPLYAMIFAFFAYFFLLLARRASTEILRREADKSWVHRLVKKTRGDA